jgi:hypothetical protein
MKSIKTSYWLLKNEKDCDQLPDSVCVYYDVFIDGETRPIRKKLDIPFDINTPIARFLLDHIDAILKAEGING